MATRRIRVLYMKNRDRSDLNGFSKHHLGDGRTLMVFLDLVT